MESYKHIGTGQAVFERSEPAEGVLRFLDSPMEVLAFVAGDAWPETIVISRGGTTTFMAPALSARVRGLITLQGMPESHLGILSREFGIPCVMSVSFSEGIQTRAARRSRPTGRSCGSTSPDGRGPGLPPRRPA